VAETRVLGGVELTGEKEKQFEGDKQEGDRTVACWWSQAKRIGVERAT
jgi:hypothetical protein